MQAYSGSYYVRLIDGEGLSQNISTSIGKEYTITFYHIAVEGGSADPDGRIDVYVDDNIIDTAPLLDVSDGWQQYSTSFTATNSTTKISFKNPSNTYSQSGIDDIKLEKQEEIISLKLITGDTILKEEGSPKFQIQIQSSIPAYADINLLITFNSITPNASSNDINYTQLVKLDAGTSNSAPMDINAVDDATYEEIETFYLLPQITLGPGTISDDTLFFSIIDNEPPLVSFSIDETEIDEDGGESNLTITLSRTYDQPSKVALNYEEHHQVRR